MRIIFTVTNDLSYDQRMHRICGSLAVKGHRVLLVGRALPRSVPLENKVFGQKRLVCFFQKGFPFYAEYNLRLFFFLLFASFDAVCSIDLDSLPAGCLATLLRRKKRVFDAHEYFTQVPEVVNRPAVQFFWEMVAKLCLPFYKHAYTVGPALAKIFSERYKLSFGVVRNVPRASVPGKKTGYPKFNLPPGPGVLYMGALNEARGIETALEAMQYLDQVHLWLAGEGDLSDSLRRLAAELGVEKKVTFLGYVKPEDLHELAAHSWLGLNLLENRGLSYYYSLANKFFASVQVGVPILTMDFPEYRALNNEHEVAVLLPELTPQIVANIIDNLLKNKNLYENLHQNCQLAAKDWNWEKEEGVLLNIWERVFQNTRNTNFSS